MKNILVIGGTRFFGKVLVEELLEKGNRVTIATRGIAKDNYGNKVQRIILDRDNEESILRALNNKYFDLIYDNICYSSNGAKKLCEVIKDKTKKYIVVSSASVYESGLNIDEEKFNPYEHEVIWGERNDFQYAEGKRQAESVVYQKFNIPSIAVRFPVVLGEDDYTKRLEFYVESILNEVPIKIDNLECEYSFISNIEAGKFLAYLSNIDYTGTINAASHEVINLKEIIKYIEYVTGKKAILKQDGVITPYNEMLECTLNTEKARNFGFKFFKIRDYIFKLIDKYLESKK